MPNLLATRARKRAIRRNSDDVQCGESPSGRWCAAAVLGVPGVLEVVTCAEEAQCWGELAACFVVWALVRWAGARSELAGAAGRAYLRCAADAKIGKRPADSRAVPMHPPASRCSAHHGGFSMFAACIKHPITARVRLTACAV